MLTVFPSNTAFLVAIGPYVIDQGQWVLWQDQSQQLYGLQARANPQEILALRQTTIIQGLGIEDFTPNVVQRMWLNRWVRAAWAATNEPNGAYRYLLLFNQASSQFHISGSSSISAALTVTPPDEAHVTGTSVFTGTLSRTRNVQANPAGSSDTTGDIIVV